MIYLKYSKKAKKIERYITKCLKILSANEKNKHMLFEMDHNAQFGAHKLNINSSRSHCLFTIYIESKSLTSEEENIHIDMAYRSVIRCGKITFVDLAGSEKLKDSQQQTVKGLRETANINRSLFTLGNVIGTLDAIHRGQLHPSTHVPYRDSVLTKLLMDSLGGNGLAVMLTCVSPAERFLEETLAALQYASRARNIRNTPALQINPKDRVYYHNNNSTIKLKFFCLLLSHLANCFFKALAAFGTIECCLFLSQIIHQLLMEVNRLRAQNIQLKQLLLPSQKAEQLNRDNERQKIPKIENSHFVSKDDMFSNLSHHETEMFKELEATRVEKRQAEVEIKEVMEENNRLLEKIGQLEKVFANNTETNRIVYKERKSL
ncbi:hypothetical protein RFI_19039 [Reticulomyxa filosa]|uniref:Kinesin-like protein n=1 Tax=Reticulomyxa filosa TaxID=46433 RepID=X6MX79_RETFI|nr:hypothetical protein RFI_19039 [Reticulomyxa filosa]|eukprot:ETO18241.1 hypothetical protein RFI_19039 [Reticulomyxa filosa]